MLNHICPACGGALRRLGQDADEALEIEPVASSGSAAPAAICPVYNLF